MQWNSLADFLHMGGYGPYVWGSFGVSAGAFVVEQWLLRRRIAAIVASLRRRARAERAGRNQG